MISVRYSGVVKSNTQKRTLFVSYYNRQPYYDIAVCPQSSVSPFHSPKPKRTISRLNRSPAAVTCVLTVAYTIYIYYKSHIANMPSSRDNASEPVCITTRVYFAGFRTCYKYSCIYLSNGTAVCAPPSKLIRSTPCIERTQLWHVIRLIQKPAHTN